MPRLENSSNAPPADSERVNHRRHSKTLHPSALRAFAASGGATSQSFFSAALSPAMSASFLARVQRFNCRSRLRQSSRLGMAPCKRDALGGVSPCERQQFPRYALLNASQRRSSGRCRENHQRNAERRRTTSDDDDIVCGQREGQLPFDSLRSLRAFDSAAQDGLP